jgi:hypothetical protein
MVETQKLEALTELAAPSVLEIKDDIIKSLLLASATKVTGTWTVTVRLNCGGATEFSLGCEQRMKALGEPYREPA